MKILFPEKALMTLWDTHEHENIFYHILSEEKPFKELGPEVIRNRKSKKNEQSMIRELGKVGYII